jgi:hypothetical protein
MSFYNYRTERELMNGSDRKNRNPWFVKTGNSIAHTSVDDIAVGDYSYYQQHKTLSQGIVFYYECNDGGSGTYEVFDSTDKIRGEIAKFGGGINSAGDLYNSTGAIRGCWRFTNTTLPSIRFISDVFYDTLRYHKSWSIAFWAKTDAWINEDTEVMGRTETINTLPDFRVYQRVGGTFRLGLYGEKVMVIPPKTREVQLADLNNVFQRYLVTYNGTGNETDANRMKSYKDGVLHSVASTFENMVGTTDFSDTTNLDFYLGGNSAFVYSFDLNQVVLWDRELSADEVAVDYNNGDGLLWSPQVFPFNCSAFDRHDSEYDNFQTGEDRGKHTEMVVTNFNAPGSHKTVRGFMDKESLTLSANNALPWRNLEEREVLTATIPYQPPTIPTSDLGVSWLNRTMTQKIIPSIPIPSPGPPPAM